MAAETFHDVRHILQKWDKGNCNVRKAMLRDFIDQCSNMTAPELERQFCDCASLFLARVTVWLRINYLHGPLKLMLKAIDIFVSSASGHHFLAEFLEVGGVLTVIEVIGLQEGREGAKAEALQLLSSIATRGRQFKELLCESYVVKVVAECLALSSSEQTQELAQHLLHQLFTGNPHYQSQVYKALIGLLPSSSPTAQRMAANTLREIQPSMGAVSVAIVEPTLLLLRSLHADVQYEASCLLQDLVRYEEVQQSILTGLVGLLKLPDSDLTHSQSGVPLPIHLQQAGAARVISSLTSQSTELAHTLTDLHVVPHLLHAMANTCHADSQKQASLALHVLLQPVPTISDDIQHIMGTSFLERFMSSPADFYSTLTPSEIDVMIAAVVMDSD